MMDVDAEDYDGNTVMHRACEKGITYIVKHLLSIGASCHMVNCSGFTPLHLAIKNKAVWLKDCKLLHAWYLAGADMNQDDYNGQTALHAAVEKRDKHMVSKLLEYGASPEHKNIWGKTAADEARMKNLHEILLLFNPPYPLK